MSYMSERHMDEMERGDEPQEMEEDGFVTVHPKLDGYPPGHYKSWNGDIPDVSQD